MGQIRLTNAVVPRVGGDYEPAPPHAKQIVFPHHPQHAFMVDLEAAVLQFRGDSAIAVGGPFQRHPLHLIAQFHFHRAGLAWQTPAIEAGPAQAGDLTQRIHGLAFRRGLLDFFKQAPPPLAAAGG